MTGGRRRALTLATIAVATGCGAAGARAQLLPPPGPWPAPVAGGDNPLTGSAFVFNGANATPNTSLRVWLASRHARRTAITRVGGAHAVVRGRLRSRDNHHAISGATIQVAASNAGGADGWYVVATARTNRRGQFRVALPAGPTRRVAVLYWPLITSPAPVTSRRLLVRASGRVFVKTAMLPGRRIVYRGQVSGAATPPGGLLVAAQVRNGRSWVTVRLVRTLASGRFVARYRFKYTGRRFAVRAVVPAQNGWPLFSGHSHTERVRTR